MKPRRKNISYRTTQPHPSANSSKIPISVKQTSSVKIQTDNAPIGELCSFENQPIEEIKEVYEKCLIFTNKTHEYINGMLKDCDLASGFLIPNVPDYFKITDVLLKCESIEQMPDSFSEKKVEPVILKPQADEKRIFDLQQFLPLSNIGDGPVQNQTCPFMERDANFFKKFPMFHDIDMQKKKPISVSPPMSIKSSEQLHHGHNKKKLVSRTFEEIINTCNEVKNKSIENLLQNDVPLNEPPLNTTLIPGLETCIKKYYLDQGDQSNLVKNNEELDNSGFNLFEYALKKCKPYQADALMSPPQMSPRSLSPQNDTRIIKNHQNNGLNFKNSPVKVLNESKQSHMPQKVNEMFRKISRENIEKSNKTDDELPEGVENQGGGNVPTFLKRSTRTEYEGEIYCKNVIQWDPQIMARVASKNTTENFKMDKSQYNSAASLQNCIASNPLRLSDRDKSRANAKALKDIGLFNEMGDMRPSVMRFIKDRQRIDVTQNNSKNIKFKTPRKFDLQVKFNNPNVTSAETSSEKSYDSDELQEQMSDENESVYSAQNTVLSTVSDSDFIGSCDVDNTSMANTSV